MKVYSDYHTADLTNYDLLKEFAKDNRRNATDAERCLWEILKNNNLGHKFRRQHIVEGYIADFINIHAKLIIEVDGEYHHTGDQPLLDEQRSQKLESQGYTILRFTNEEALQNTEKVINQILNKLSELNNTQDNYTPTSGIATPTSPSPTGEGRGGAAWAVDAGCSGNPGPMEYQCVDLQTGAKVFHFGPIKGTNNIGEFLAIVHALALMEKQGITGKVIYSDSVNAQLWVKKMQCKTKLEMTPETAKAHELVQRAELWLRTHAFRVPIIKWDTKNWGEIPADFGRK